MPMTEEQEEWLAARENERVKKSEEVAGKLAEEVAAKADKKKDKDKGMLTTSSSSFMVTVATILCITTRTKARAKMQSPTLMPYSLKTQHSTVYFVAGGSLG